jgi:hypothetical protein
MKIYPRSYKYEAGQKCSVDNCNNLVDVEVVLYYNSIYVPY